MLNFLYRRFERFPRSLCRKPFAVECWWILGHFRSFRNVCYLKVCLPKQTRCEYSCRRSQTRFFIPESSFKYTELKSEFCSLSALCDSEAKYAWKCHHLLACCLLQLRRKPQDTEFLTGRRHTHTQWTRTVCGVAFECLVFVVFVQGKPALCGDGGVRLH